MGACFVCLCAPPCRNRGKSYKFLVSETRGPGVKPKMFHEDAKQSLYGLDANRKAAMATCELGFEMLTQN